MRSTAALALLLVPCLALASPGASSDNLARLHGTVVPKAQTVNLTLDPSKSEFSGSVRIELKATAASDSFQLNVRGVTLTSAKLSSASGPIEVTWAAAPLERLTFRPTRKLEPGDYALDIDFTNVFDAKATGLYRLQSGGDWYAFTQFESDDARQAFPCWDEPEFKIPWTLTLTVPSGMVTLANTPVARTADQQGTTTVSFKTSPPMPSYLVAFCVGPFESVPITGLSVPGRIYTVKGQKDMVGEAVRMTPPILAALEGYFKRPYPYEKLDFISVPEYNWGAMENPGAVTFAERVIVLDAKQTTDQQRRRLASVIAHELAHMWFGDLVTMEWWDDLWLNESFASWMGDKITHQVYPQFNTPVQELEQLARAYKQDDHVSTHAIRRRIDENVNLSQLADALAYDKGQAVLGMLERWIGAEAFQKGMVDYVNTHAWGNAEAADLWAALSRSSGKDIASVGSTFLDQPGVPIVQAELVSGKKVRLSQQRFLGYGETAPAALTWKIPVMLRFSDGKQVHTQRVLLTEPTQTVALEPSIKPVWIHPNADERGYYHWEVSPELLSALSGKARPQLSDRERVGFVGNLGALLQGGMLHGDDFMRTISAFGDDPTPEVVTAMVEGLAGAKVAFVTPELRGAYALYLRRTLQPALDRVGETPRPGEGPGMSALRARLMSMLGTDGEDARLRKKGLEMTRAYLADANAVDPTLADAMLRIAACSNDTSLYYEYRRRFEGSKTPTERRRFLTALGYFEDPAIHSETLRYILEGPLRPQETGAPLRGIDREELQELTWQWAQKNYDALVGKMPPMFRVYMVYFAAGCSKQRLDSAKAFFSQPEHSPQGTEDELAQLSDQVMSCVSLREREGPRVAKMLNELTASK